MGRLKDNAKRLCLVNDLNKLKDHIHRFTSYATGVGFQHSKIDYSLFMFHRGFDIAYLLLYVVDMILTYPSSTFLQQSTYGDEIFERVHMQKYNTCRTHVDIESKLGANELTLSLSSFEAEYRGVANVVAETAWRTKHIDIDIHFVRDFVASRQFMQHIIQQRITYTYGDVGGYNHYKCLRISTWQALGGYTRDLNSFGKKRDKIAALQQSGFKNCSQSLEMASQFPSEAVKSYKRWRQKNYDGVRM
nr:hypothetical protein [Tanacetum cinerariifolium]